jgi:hypothetical protein
MLHHMATILVSYGDHFESKMAAKIKKSSDLGKIWFSSRSCIFSDFFNFYIGSHFEMAASLKNLETKCTTLSDDLFVCHVSKGSTDMATISVCYGGHFESKMATKLQKSSDLDEIWFPCRL